MKIGLVGIGGFGQGLLRYIRKLQEEDRLRPAAVCGTKPFRAASYREFKLFKEM